jgi:hypothetical protein
MPSDFDTLFQDQAVPLVASVFGEDVLLRREGSEEEVTAEIAVHEEEETDDRGFRMAWRGVKVTILAADYKVDGEAVTPAKGDQIIRPADDGISVIYTVLSRKNKPLYEKIADGRQLRVYAKETGSE